MEILSQRDPRWANIKLGNSAYYIWAKGSFITEIAQAIGTTPDIVNEKLTALDGYADDGTGNKALVIWEKAQEAFPEWIITYHSTYNNDDILGVLAAGKKVLVEVDAAPIEEEGLHCVEYIGEAQCYNCWPNPAEQISTSFFPGVHGYIVFTKKAVEQTTATENPNIYKGVDLTNIASMKVAIDTLRDVEDGIYIKKEQIKSLLNLS